MLVEPTSAVDAHTEARIAARLTEAQAGRTTVVMSASPLILDRADHVVFLRDGKAVATGTHQQAHDRAPRLPAHRRPRGGGLMSLTPAPATAPCPSPTRPRCGRTRATCSAVTAAALLRVIGLHRSRLWPRWSRPASSACSSTRSATGGRSEVVNTLALWIAGAVVVQTVVTWFARRASFVMGETVFAELREQFMGRVVELPLSTVERAGTGDLVSRTTNDVEALSHVIRFGVPSIFVGAVTTAITVIAAFVTGGRWRSPSSSACRSSCCRRAATSATRPRATCASGPRMPCSTGSSPSRPTVRAPSMRWVSRGGAVGGMDDALRDCYDAEIYTLKLRMRWFPSVEFAFFMPVAVTLLWGGWLISRDVATIGTVTAVALYVQQMAGPLDELISWLDEIQVGATSLARVIGIADVPPDRAATGEEPADDHLEVEDVHYSYRAGRDVLRGVSLDLARASGSRSSDPPVRASRRWAASWPASTDRGRAGSRSAACGSSTSSSRSCVARSRS